MQPRQPDPSGFAERSVGEIATGLPGASAVFRERRLDLCCGGEPRLASAAAERALSLDDLVERIHLEDNVLFPRFE